MKTEIHPLRVVIKALCLFVLINIVYALVDPPVYEISAYNAIFPGRVRLPFGDVGGDPHALIVDNVDVMFASHAVSKPKGANEYRVILIGDSSIWGENLAAEKSLAPQWNKSNVQCADRIVRVYNLSYPHPSVIKDLILIDKAVEYKPDLVLWFVTLNTLIPRRLSPFLVANSDRAIRVLGDHHISLAQDQALLENESTFYQRTLVGKRSQLARLIKLQMLGLVWTATDADMSPPSENASVSPNVENDSRLDLNGNLRHKLTYRLSACQLKKQSLTAWFS